jgi:hypothetical protein
MIYTFCDYKNDLTFRYSVALNIDALIPKPTKLCTFLKEFSGYYISAPLLLHSVAKTAIALQNKKISHLQLLGLISSCAFICITLYAKSTLESCSRYANFYTKLQNETADIKYTYLNSIITEMCHDHLSYGEGIVVSLPENLIFTHHAIYKCLEAGIPSFNSIQLGKLDPLLRVVYYLSLGDRTQVSLVDLAKRANPENLISLSERFRSLFVYFTSPVDPPNPPLQ